MAFTSVAALIGGAAVETALVLSAITEIGIASTIVGAVTGNKSLLKLGGVMSLVGGVGGMLAGASGGAAAAGEGVLGDAAAADAMSMTVPTAEQAASAGLDLGSTAADAMSVTVPTEAASSMSGLDIAPSATPAAAPWEANYPAAEVAPATPVAPSAVSQAAPDVAQNAATPGSNIAAPAPATAPSSDMTTGDFARTDRAMSQYAPVKSQSYFDSILDFVKKNKEVSNSILQLGGGLLKGMSDSSIADKKFALEQQALDQKKYGNQVATYKPTGFIQSARA